MSRGADDDAARSAGKRRLDMLAQLAGNGGTLRLCHVCRDATGATGAGIMLMSATTSNGSVCTTDAVSALLESLQYDLGEGPCIDAYLGDAPVAEPDIGSPARARWPAFAPPALAAGARAVFGFPLRVGAARLGALNLYRATAGPLSDAQHGDALIAADIAAQAVLLMQAGAPPGRLASELDDGGEFHFVVHQAAGMIAAQLGVDVAQALVRLRGHAFGNGRDLTEVAHDVVERRLRLEPSAEGHRPQ
ncbi:MAG TPA: ANTAR domain-containing protein [Acidimicrobiales bacterium]|nr:ANTAR domain-containing protein [Acidimicrobiales bacterium]